MERALVVIKPDGVEKELIGRVIARFEDEGLKVIGVKMVKATSALVGRHYAVDEGWLMAVGRSAKIADAKRGRVTDESEREIGMRIRSYLMKELARLPVVAIALEGRNANKIARKAAGATEPKSAEKGTIRAMYSTDSYKKADSEKRSIRNIVHVSDSERSASREIKVWFRDNELYSYRTVGKG